MNDNFDVQMAREMDEILRQQIAQPANSCNSENGVSFLDQVIIPLYDVMAAVRLSDHLLLDLLNERIYCFFFI